MMTRRMPARGVALPITLLALILVIGLVVSVSTMNQGLKSQIFHSSNHQWSFLLAYSAMAKVLAKIHTVSWGQRPFAAKPYREFQVPLQGGVYDLFVENTPGHDYQADIYVKTTLTGVSRLYFWRITFNDDLLDVSNRIVVEFFKSGDPADFPTSAGPSKFSKTVDDMLAERAGNQKKADDLASELAPLTTAGQVLGKIKGRQPVPFTKSYPANPGETAMAGRPAVPFPAVAPPSAGELPTANGPGPAVPLGGAPPAGSNPGGGNPGGNPAGSPGAGGSDFPSIPSDSGTTDATLHDLTSTVSAVASAAKSALDLFNSGKNLADQNGGGQWDAARPDFIAAGEQMEKSIGGMGELIDQAKDNLQNAPSAAAAKATEELVSSTVVTAIKDIVSGLVRAGEDFKNAASIVGNQTTAAAAQALLDGWIAIEAGAKSNQARLNGLLEKVSGFSKTAAVVAAEASAVQAMQTQVTMIEQAVAMATARVAELQAQEAAAAAAAANATPDPYQGPTDGGDSQGGTGLPPLGPDTGSGDQPAP
ncbi:MAG: hypothetical protein GX442_14955 [Candidatus Riflebacteria bacterium]|nr:hypothetical protein [Candidatus Riflebacteria bacterium]